MSAIKLSHVVTSLVFILLLAGCAAPTPEFTDPLAGLGRSADNRSDFAHLTLGLILSENAEKSMEYLRENRAKFDIPVFANQAGAADLDPVYLTSGLNDVLTRRFRDVIRLDDFDSARSTNTDIVLLLDIRTEIGGMSFKTTSVQISGIFLNDNQEEIGRVEGTGRKKVPYPASTFQFKAATNEALTNFSGNLDGDPDLATTLNASVLERVAAASLPAAPSQSERNWTFGGGSGFGQYHALVIGNNHYRSLPQLRTAIADAESVAATLAGRYGFIVATLADATRADILRALNQLRRTLTPRDNLLLLCGPRLAGRGRRPGLLVTDRRGPGRSDQLGLQRVDH